MALTVGMALAMRAGTCCVGKARDKCSEASPSLLGPLFDSSPCNCQSFDSSASESFLVDVYGSSNVTEPPTTSYPCPTWVSIPAPGLRTYAHSMSSCLYHLSMAQRLKGHFRTKTFSVLCKHLREERGRGMKKRPSG